MDLQDAMVMLDVSLRVLQPMLLSDWTRPATTIHELLQFHIAGAARNKEFAVVPDSIVPDSIGRFLLEKATTTLPCLPPLLLDRPQERSLFFPQGIMKPVYDVPLAAVRLDTVPMAHVVGEKFVVVSHDSKVFSESYWAEQNLNDGTHFRQPVSTVVGAPSIRIRPTTLYIDRSPTRTVSGTTLLLGNPWSFNYHHWVINCLSRLWWTDQYPELHDVPLIVPGQLLPFHRQSLTAMGVDAERILPMDGGSWQIERLLFPANGDFWPNQLRWIRNRLYEHFGIRESTGTRLLYLSRTDATSRRIVNERQIIETLSARGFEVLQLSGMSLEEQVQIFSQAKMVVAPHGSGLTNVLFGAPNLSVVELHPRDEVNHVFWVLASAMQQKYAFLSGPRTNSHRDFEIDPADLDTLIDRCNH